MAWVLDGKCWDPMCSHRIPVSTQQFPCLQVPRAVGAQTMARSLHGTIWVPMGASGPFWEQSWELCFFRVTTVLPLMLVEI